jgi:hypothetical protein
VNDYLDNKPRRAKRDEVRIDSVLNSALSPVMRQIRKFAALRALLNALPAELEGLAAPFDIRQAPRRSSFGTAASADGAAATVSTAYVYVSGAAVEAVIEQRMGELVEQANSALPYPLIEELRCEQASPAKIEKQLNILRIEPD